MCIPRLDVATYISDKLNVFAAVVKTRSRANLTDANNILEHITARFLNALFGWNLRNLNLATMNYPAADLGDTEAKIAVQVTNMESSEKIRSTVSRARKYKLGTSYKRLIIFFLLPRRPRFPQGLRLPSVLKVEAWDLADLLKEMEGMKLSALEKAANVLKEELPEELNKIDRGKPKLLARFQEDDGGICVAGDEREDAPSYCMDLWIEGAPEETKRVTFEILDDSVWDGTWTVSRGNEAREFITTDGFNSYGNYVICARGKGTGAGNWFQQSTLYDALARFHGRAPRNRAIQRALRQIARL